MKRKHVVENIVDNTIRMEHDHEVQMARAQLYRAAKCAVELHDMLRNFSDRQDLEGWVQAKITMAAEQLESVKNHLEYEVISGEIPLVGDEYGDMPIRETSAGGMSAASVAAVAKPMGKRVIKRTK
jgi:hypothetical protein